MGDSELPDFDGEMQNKDELHIPCPNGHVLVVTRDCFTGSSSVLIVA